MAIASLPLTNGEMPTATRAHGAAIDCANDDDIFDEAADDEDEKEGEANGDDDEGARCVCT